METDWIVRKYLCGTCYSGSCYTTSNFTCGMFHFLNTNFTYFMLS